MIPWRREQLPSPVFWPEEFHGQRSLAGYSSWVCKESNMTKQLSLSLFCQKKQTCMYSSMVTLFSSFLLGLANEEYQEMKWRNQHNYMWSSSSLTVILAWAGWILELNFTSSFHVAFSLGFSHFSFQKLLALLGLNSYTPLQNIYFILG